MPARKKMPRQISMSSIEDVIGDLLVRDGEAYNMGERARTPAERDDAERIGSIFEGTANGLQDALESGRKSDVAKVLKGLNASLKGLDPADVEAISATRHCIEELEALIR